MTRPTIASGSRILTLRMLLHHMEDDLTVSHKIERTRARINKERLLIFDAENRLDCLKAELRKYEKELARSNNERS